MKIKKSSRILLIGTLVLILGLIFASWWNYKEFKKLASKRNIIKFDIPNLGLKTETQKPKPSQDFLVPDGDLKVTYPGSWQKIESSNLSLEGLSSEKVKTLFYGMKADATKMKAAWLIIQKLNFGEEKDVEKIIEEIKNDAKKRDTKVEIQNLKIKGNSAEFEMQQTQSGYSIKGEEKIIFTQKNTYSVMIFSLTSQWDSFQKEAGEILNSVQITPPTLK